MNDEKVAIVAFSSSLHNSPDIHIHTMDGLPNNEATRSSLKVPTEQDLRVACFCEENVYRLVYRKLLAASSMRYYVVFLSSETQCVPMFYQKAVSTPTSACLWDYHVILLQVSGDNSAHILDMDSHLPYPCPLETYVQHAFPVKDGCTKSDSDDYAPLFRVVRGETFLQHFHSDRLHMFQDGEWNAPPPTYACITIQDDGESTSNLDSYRLMTKRSAKDQQLSSSPSNTSSSNKEELESLFRSKFGAVVNEQELLHHFGAIQYPSK
jgi:hypothetical protein